MCIVCRASTASVADIHKMTFWCTSLASLPAHAAFAFTLITYRIFSDRRRLQLIFGKDILQVLPDVVRRRIEEICHLPLREPHSLLLQPYVDSDFAIWRLVDHDLAACLTAPQCGTRPKRAPRSLLFAAAGSAAVRLLQGRREGVKSLLVHRDRAARRRLSLPTLW